MNIEKNRYFLTPLILFALISMGFTLLEFRHFRSIKSFFRGTGRFDPEVREVSELAALVSREDVRYKKKILLVENYRMNYSYLIYRVRYLVYPLKIDFAVPIGKDSYRVEDFDYRKDIESFKAAAFYDTSYGSGIGSAELRKKYDVILTIKDKEIGFLKKI